MTTYPWQPQWVSRPGDTISHLMSRQALDVARLAGRMGKDRGLIQQLIAGTAAIDDEMAASLALHLGGTENFWRNRQLQFDQALDRAVGAISADDARDWLSSLPMADLARSGWIARGRGTAALRSVCAYFGVSSPSEWQRHYTSFANAFSYRTSQGFENKLGALAAWLRQGEVEADDVFCEPWDANKLKKIVPEIRRLTKLKKPSQFISKLRGLCASAGVALVFVRAPAGCSASGATRFVSSKKAIIVLSFRHLSDDHFWFTLFHEIGHLLLHGRDATFIDGDAADNSTKEREANEFAERTLIPMERLADLEHIQLSTNSIIRYSVSIDIAPGIVVGQLQHHRLLGPKQLNHLKRRYSWDDIQAALVSP